MLPWTVQHSATPLGLQGVELTHPVHATALAPCRELPSKHRLKVVLATLQRQSLLQLAICWHCCTQPVCLVCS